MIESVIDIHALSYPTVPPSRGEAGTFAILFPDCCGGARSQARKPPQDGYLEGRTVIPKPSRATPNPGQAADRAIKHLTGGQPEDRPIKCLVTQVVPVVGVKGLRPRHCVSGPEPLNYVRR